MKRIMEYALRVLAAGQDLQPIYEKWFRARLPAGDRLNIPISAQLEDSFNALD